MFQGRASSGKLLLTQAFRIRFYLSTIRAVRLVFTFLNFSNLVCLQYKVSNVMADFHWLYNPCGSFKLNDIFSLFVCIASRRPYEGLSTDIEQFYRVTETFSNSTNAMRFPSINYTSKNSSPSLL